jgi:tetraacyldisaccharide 4'-kinase
MRLARRGGAVELLRVPAALFGAAALLRRVAYDSGLLRAHRLAVPVVSVGNLSTGGTGKTPMCAWLASELGRRGLAPGLLSRGYRSGADGANDEARLLAALLPGVPHVQDKDRVRGGAKLVELGCRAIVLDDGFQHRRLHRDLDLVLVDATRAWGLPAPENGGAPVRALLPRGLLREPPSSLARADAIVLTRVSQVSSAAVEDLSRELERCAPGIPILRADHRPIRFAEHVGGDRGRALSLDAFADRDVDLVSGIGNPEAFERTVRSLGARVRAHRAFEDHHDYLPADLDGLGTGRVLLTTAKDAGKLAAIRASFVALEVEIAFASGANVLEALLDALQAGTHG